MTIQEMNESGVTIFSLWRDGFFRQDLPERCEQLSISRNETAPAEKAAPFVWNKENLAIQGSEPQNELMEQLLGKDSLKYAWSSFAFSALPDFNLYVISKSALLPENITCCDTDGKIIQYANQSSGQKNDRKGKEYMEKTTSAKNTKVIILLLLLLISVLMNVFLIYDRKNEVKASHIDKDALRAEIIADLAKSFPEQSKIDWEKDVMNDSYLSHIFGKEYKPIQKIKVYIEFMNKNILTSKPEMRRKK